jgi:hypothetical protein
VILHIATFRWNDDVTPADVTALTEALQAMAAAIPEIQSYTAGPNLRVRPSPADYGVAALVADESALVAYLDHPEHKSVYEQYLGRMIAERSAAQLPISQGSFA